MKMRDEEEMYGLILGFANNDSRIRAVILNGSRANPAAKRDMLQDFDIVYLVDKLESFTCDHSWIDVFGEKLVYQLPDISPLYPDEQSEDSFGYLMQFADGNRIDLTVAKKEKFSGYCFGDRLSVILLDKDGLLPQLPPPDDSSHYITPPTKELFDACRCEFWWVSPYVAKGLWRGQLLFAQQHMEACIRGELRRMLAWCGGISCDYRISAGKCGDGLSTLLPHDMWEKYLSTYSPCRDEDIWNSLFAAGDLFSDASQHVAQHFGYTITDAWDKNVPKYLHYLYTLPHDADHMNFEL